MNKITTSLLAGVALAAIAVAPASAANGIFNNTTTTLTGFSFAPGFSSYTLNAAPVIYYTQTAAPVLGTLTLSGGTLIAGTSYAYANTLATFTPNGGGAGFSETGTTNVNTITGVPSFSALTPGLSAGDDLNLNYAAVPEASTVISFGALLALGGLAVLRRKSVARAS